MPQDESTKAASLRYALLKQTHPDYDAKLLDELEDFYRGGYTIQRKAQKYLAQLVGESPERHDERVGSVAYQNYFGQIVDQFTSDLFAQPLNVTPAADATDTKTPGEVPDKVFYPEFEKDADRCGAPFTDVVKSVMLTALKKRVGVVALDAPSVSSDVAPKSKAEEEAAGGGRLYAYELPVEDLVDWHVDDVGGFKWAIVHTVENDRESPTADRSKTVETFMVWTMNGAVARWDAYAITYTKDEKPNDETLVPHVGGDDTTFKRIPLIRLELPEGLWVGNKIGPQAKEHFQRRSELVSAEKRSLVAIPFVKRGPEIGAPGAALPSETQENPHRGSDPVGATRRKGWVEIGSDDEIGFAEPTGGCYELVDKQLTDLKTEMFRVCHQMAASVAPTPAAIGRSGVSKQEDGAATAVVLGALGHYARMFALTVYKTISDCRGEDVSWTAHGLDNFEVDDRAQVLEEALDVDQIAIPSATFKKHFKYNLASKLIGTVDPQTLATIKTEIEDGVDSEEEHREVMREAQVDGMNAAANAPDDMPGGNDMPPPRAPIAKTGAPKAKAKKKAASSVGA